MSLTKVTYSMIDGASVNVKDFGATGNGSTDDTAAIQAAIDYLRLALNPSNTNHAAQYQQAPYALYFPAGKYMVSTPLVFDFIVNIVGATTGNYGSVATEIKFTSTYAGLVFLWSLSNRFPIYNFSTNTVTSISTTAGTPGQILAGSPATGNSSNSNILNMRITGSGATNVYNTTFSGIEARVVVNMTNVFVEGFKGCGIRILGNDGGNSSPSGAFNINSWGGADGWNFQSVQADANDGHGFFCYGGDTNIGVHNVCQWTNNKGWGVYDVSGLGNVYLGGQASYNSGNGFADFVGSISGTTLTVTSIPYSDDTSIYMGIGHYVKGTGVTANTTILYQISGTLGQEGTYQLSQSSTVSSSNLYTQGTSTGSWGSFQGTGKNLFLNCYAEDGVKHIGRDALNIHGISNGGIEGWQANYPAALGVGGGVVLTAPSTLQAVSGSIQQSSSLFRRYETVETTVTPAAAAAEMIRITNETYLGGGANTALRYSSTFPQSGLYGPTFQLILNNESYCPFWITAGTGATFAYGTSTAIPGQFTVSSLAINQRRLMNNDALPSSGNYAKGDVIFNTSVNAGGSPGWVCTTAGVAGSTAVFKTMAVVAA